MRPKLAVAFGAGDDVDGSGKCLAAIHSAGTSLNHFDALDVVNAEGKINGQVASVWIGDVDAVEQNGELVLSASVHPYVGLDAESSSLSHIHTCCEFEQVVDGVGAGCLNVLAANDLPQPNGFVGRERCACGCHLGGSKLQFKHGRVLVGLSLRLFVDGCVLSGLLAVTHSHLCCSRFGACNSKSGYAEYPDVDFFFQTEEDGIAVASKVVPHDGFLLLTGGPYGSEDRCENIFRIKDDFTVEYVETGVIFSGGTYDPAKVELMSIDEFAKAGYFGERQTYSSFTLTGKRTLQSKDVQIYDQKGSVMVTLKDIKCKILEGTDTWKDYTLPKDSSVCTTGYDPQTKELILEVLHPDEKENRTVRVFYDGFGGTVDPFELFTGMVYGG